MQRAPFETRAFLAGVILLTMVAGATTSRAQTRPELAAARKTFAEALVDEEQKRFDVSLEKFRRVQAVKDTVPVRYRIGTSLEGLGRLSEARAAFDGAIALGAGDPKSGDIVQAAREHRDAITRRMPTLTLVLPDKRPADAKVEIDHGEIAAEALERPISLDPGSHAVDATATGSPPFHTDVTLPEGGTLSLTIPLTPPPPPPVAAPPPPPPRPAPTARTPAWITIGAGAALVAGAGVVLLVRHGDISSLKDACPNGACPPSRRDELTSTRSRALAEGPIAAVLGGVGLVGIGVGGYLLWRAARHDRAAGVGVVPLTDGGRFVVRGSF